MNSKNRLEHISREAALQGKKLVLNVGCGPDRAENLLPMFHTPEWRQVRLDIDPDVAPDILASITDMAPVPSGFIDALWSSHNLEHLLPHEAPLALEGFHRVLKPGGFAIIAVPDLQVAAGLIADNRLEDVAYESPGGPITPKDMLYGYDKLIEGGNLFMIHKTGFTAWTLAGHLERAGFRGGQVWREGWTVWAWAVKPS